MSQIAGSEATVAIYGHDTTPPLTVELLKETFERVEREHGLRGGNPLLPSVDVLPLPMQTAAAKLHALKSAGDDDAPRRSSKSSMLKQALIVTSVAGVLAAGVDRLYINPLIHSDPTTVKLSGLPADYRKRRRGHAKLTGHCGGCGKKKRNCRC